MDTTVVALQGLYVAMGGTASTVENIVTIPDMINAMTALVTSGATAKLPAVTASDNGKVLKVVDGEWAVGTDATA